MSVRFLMLTPGSLEASFPYSSISGVDDRDPAGHGLHDLGAPFLVDLGREGLRRRDRVTGGEGVRRKQAEENHRGERDAREHGENSALARAVAQALGATDAVEHVRAKRVPGC